jgi:hypothetical protein
MGKVMSTIGLLPGRPFLSPRFLICALIICANAAGLRPTMEWLEERYLKKPIAPRRSLKEFDVSALRSFRADDSFHSPPFAPEALGTEEYFNTLLEDTAPGAQARLIRLFVTYYSDPRDKIPHTPDVCARQEGVTVLSIETTMFDVTGLQKDPRPIRARVADMEQDSARAVVVYVFCANGEFCYGRDNVRWIIGRPGDRYVYVSKIEAWAGYRSKDDRREALNVCERVLAEALPVLVAEYFPDSADLKRE